MKAPSLVRVGGLCGLASIALFFVEFPLYSRRGPAPALDPASICAYASRNAGNMLTVVLLDMAIYCLFLVFLAGFRQRIVKAAPEAEGLGTLTLAAGLVYTVLTLTADSLQGTIALDARTGLPEPSAIRMLMESQYLLFGSVGLMAIALLLGAAAWATLASRALPRWTAWLALAAAALCLGFVPSMFAGAPDLAAFYNPAGWGTTGVIAGFPLAAWMIAASVLLARRNAE